jgi:23S rRNA pseudouridine1911/1915/1917 synthase
MQKTDLNIASQILFEDNHLLVINKKVGQLVQGDKTGDESLLDSIKNFIKIRDKSLEMFSWFGS